MDGIFGVGISEILVIIVIMLVVGGPKNMVKWSREAGRILRDMRLAWDRFSKEMEKELDPEAKELLKSSRQLTQNIADIRNTTDPKRLVRQVSKALEEKITLPEIPSETEAPTPNGKYSDWISKE